MVTALGYGTTGLSLGQRVFGLTDWSRDGTLAEYGALEARNLAPLPGDVDFMVGASLPISGLTAWQGLLRARPPSGGAERPRARRGRRSRVDGDATRTRGRRLRHRHRTRCRPSDGARLRRKGCSSTSRNDDLKDVGAVDLVFDVIGGDIGKRSAGLIRAGGTLASIVGPPEARPADGLAVDFVVESDRAQLSEIVQRVRDGRLRTNIGNVSTLDDAVAAFNPTERIKGKTITAFVREDS